jgi:hypothetical protein
MHRVQLPALLDEMIAAGRIEPVIAVFVDARDPDRLDADRRNQQLICKLNYARRCSRPRAAKCSASWPTTGGSEDRLCCPSPIERKPVCT